MTRDNAPFAALATLFAFVGVATLSLPAHAEDFNFEVPIELSTVAPGATQLNIVIDCYVSSRRFEEVTIADIAERREIVTFIRTTFPITDSRVVNLRMNARPGSRASEARYWRCTLLAGAHYAGGYYDVLNPAVYEDLTGGRRLLRTVTSVEGEIRR
jgi:hypothetical protein